MGFDGEPTGMDKSMIKLIEETGINMAMVGLLVALPNTQLTRRLLKEKRLLSFQGKLIHSEDEIWASATAQNSVLDVVDQTVAGLNFVTTRDRLEILSEYKNVVESVYAPKAYFDRLLRTGLALKTVSKHRPRWFEIKRQARGLVRLSRKMSANKETRWLFWRNFMRIILRGPHVIEQVLRVTGIYLHFAKQVKFLSKELERTKQVQRDIQNAMLDRSA
jgi:hypothetical protein